MHYKNKVVFRVTKYGDYKGELDTIMADVKDCGLETSDGFKYENNWYLYSTRPATPEEYASTLRMLNSITVGGDTYEFIPVKKRTF